MSNLNRQLKRFLTFNVARVYLINYLALLLTAVGYFAYIGFTALRNGHSLRWILRSSAYTSVMLVVVFLNILVGYFLWVYKDYVLQNKSTVTLIFIPLMFCQLFLGNIIVFATSLLTYVNAKDVVKEGHWIWTLKNVEIILVISLYLLCLSLILLIQFRS